MRSATKPEHPHIERKPGVCGGEPIIKGTRFPVRSIVEYIYQEGRTPEEMIRSWTHLTLAQIYDALSFYHDHKGEIDRLIRKNQELAKPPSARR